MSRSGASVLVAALIAVVELPAARADRGATCTSRLSTALAGLAAAARDADAATVAARFANDADHRGLRALARLARDVAASAQAAETASLHRAVAALIRLPPVISITGACVAPA